MNPSKIVGFVLLLASCPLAGQDQQRNADALFALDHLVRVDIEMAKKDWDELRAQTRSFSRSLSKEAVKSPYKYFKGNVTIDGVRIENVGIRKKGFLGSLDRSRPSLKIKFDRFRKAAQSEKHGPSPWAGLDRLTLNNNKQDPTQACAVLALKLFRDAGSPASRCNHARVTMNGELLGIYSNIESIKPPMLKRLFGDASGNLYEGTVSDFMPEGVVKFQRKTKDTKLDPLQEVTTIVNKAPIDLPALEKLLDVDAFLKFWALESLTGFWDGYTNNQNNFFLYQKPSNGKLYFMPWGVDSAFVTTMPMPPYIIKTKAVHSQSVLSNLLYRLPEIQARYRKTLESLLADVWKKDELFAELDRIEALVADHLHENQRGSAKAFRKMRAFVKTRHRVMERSLKRWPVKFSAGPKELFYFQPAGTGRATFKATYRESGAKNLRGATMELELDGEKIEFRKVVAKAERSTWPTLDGGTKPPSIVLTGERPSDGKKFILAVTIAVEDFRPSGGEAVMVQGALIEGALGFLNPKTMRMVSGDAKLTAAGVGDGDQVQGEMTVEFALMRGGEPKKMAWK